MVNHLVSELSLSYVNHLAWLFNGGLTISGLMFIPIMIGLGKRINSKIITIIGIIATLGCSLTGLFPMDTLILPHYVSAFTFFFTSAITIALVTLLLIKESDPGISKYFIIPGFVVVGIFLVLITVDFSIVLETLTLGHMWVVIKRPSVWILAIMEWAVVLAVLGYLTLLAIYFLIKIE